MPAVVHRSRTGRRTINEINMVPFIDVMLVLLIIFMVTAPLINPSMIELPSVGKAARQPDQVIQVVLSKNDTLEIKLKEQTTPVTLNSLVQTITATTSNGNGNSNGNNNGNNANFAVVISADKSISYESVVKVMDVLQRAGIQRVGLSVQLAQ
jgi:biopolymer transport protein TolR